MLTDSVLIGNLHNLAHLICGGLALGAAPGRM